MATHALPRRRTRTAGLATGAAALTALSAVLWVTSAPAAAATCSSSPDKCYRIDLSPTTFTSGASVPFTITVTNEATSQSLGSANVTAPTGYVITSMAQPSPSGTATLSGSTVQLRDLDLLPGSALTETLTAQTVDGPGLWATAAKQSNDFNGTGNDFVLDPLSNLTTTGSASSQGQCDASDVSCGTGFVDFAKVSSVTTGSHATPTVWLVGTATFPATDQTGGTFYSMHAPEQPDNICPTDTGSLATPVQCTFQMNMDPIPAPYTARYPVTLELECDITVCPPAPAGAPSGFEMVKAGDDGSVAIVPRCGSVGAGSLCYTTRLAADGNFVATVFGVTAGDPRFAGMCVGDCYPSLP